MHSPQIQLANVHAPVLHAQTALDGDHRVECVLVDERRRFHVQLHFETEVSRVRFGNETNRNFGIGANVQRQSADQRKVAVERRERQFELQQESVGSKRRNQRFEFPIGNSGTRRPTSAVCSCRPLVVAAKRCELNDESDSRTSEINSISLLFERKFSSKSCVRVVFAPTARTETSNCPTFLTKNPLDSFDLSE